MKYKQSRMYQPKFQHTPTPWKAVPTMNVGSQNLPIINDRMPTSSSVPSMSTPNSKQPNHCAKIIWRTPQKPALKLILLSTGSNK
jgi:hypothetical protein